MMANMHAAADPLATETLLLDIVGLRFLEYVLNADEAAIRAHFQGVTLEGPRERVLAELVAVLGQLVPEPDASPFLVQIQLDALGTFDPAVQMSYSSALRLRCGGAVDAGTSMDPTVDLLLTVARDMYPLFLLPVPGGPMGAPFAPSMTRSLFNHPGRPLFDDAVLADPELSLLFTDDGEQIGRSGQFRSSTGRGGSLQLMMFAEMLIREPGRR